MKLIIIPVLIVATFLVSGSYLTQETTQTIVTAYTYTAHAGIGFDQPASTIGVKQ